jgi:hypothetical protein
MRPRPIIPPGKAGVLVLAAATVPLLLSRCKPFAKKVGEKMVEWGEKLQKEVEKPEPPKAEPPSNVEVKPTAEETIKSASPTGKEEVKATSAAATAKKAAPEAKVKSPTPKKANTKAKPGAATNPKKPDTKKASTK